MFVNVVQRALIYIPWFTHSVGCEFEEGVHTTHSRRCEIECVDESVVGDGVWTDSRKFQFASSKGSLMQINMADDVKIER